MTPREAYWYGEAKKTEAILNAEVAELREEVRYLKEEAQAISYNVRRATGKLTRSEQEAEDFIKVIRFLTRSLRSIR